MNYSRERIQQLTYGELTTEQLERAVGTIQGFQEEFGNRWINRFLGWHEYKRRLEGIVSEDWIEQHFKTGSLPILDLIATWENWSLVRECRDAAKLRKRWKHGFESDGVISELYVAAKLRRAGARIEFVPEADGGRTADCRFDFENNSDWVYVEVSKRGFPDDSHANIRAKEIRDRFAKIAASLFPGLLATVVILRNPNNEEVEKIVSWLEAIEKPEEQRLDDLAVVFVGLPEQGFPGDVERVAKLMPGPMPFGAYCDETGLGIAWFNIRDNMHEKILCKEFAQLPNEFAGIVVIDTSRVVGFNWLADLASEIFEDERGIRISALIFFRSLHSGEGHWTESAVHFNPRAQKPLSFHLMNRLKSIFQ